MTAVTTPSARELTPEEHAARQQACAKLEHEIKEALRTGRAMLWVTAKSLHEFDEAQGWSALGYERLSDWLADPEIGMTRATYYRMVQAYRELVVLRRVPEEDLPELELSKVQIVLPSVKTGRVKLRAALADVRALGYRDLREEYLKPDEGSTASPEPDPEAEVEVLPPEPEPALEQPAEELPVIDGDAVGQSPLVGARTGLREAVEVERLPVYAEACETAITALAEAEALLRRVLDEVGRPEQKKMRRVLREAICEALGEETT